MSSITLNSSLSSVSLTLMAPSVTSTANVTASESTSSRETPRRPIGSFASARGLLALLLVVALTTLPACSRTKSGQAGESLDDSDPLSEENLETMESERYGDGNIPTAGEEDAYGEAFRNVSFAFDSSTVDPEHFDQLKRDAERLSSDSTLKVQVEGHCDTRGTVEYNYALGSRRAKAVAQLLVDYGASASQISTISYGEEIPLDPGDSEAAHAKNRRVQFAVFRNK